MGENNDETKKNYKKMNALYLLLIISNIILLIGLIQYYSNVGIDLHFKYFDEISAVIATIIILGFISAKLPKIRELGDSSLYGMVYLIIICAIGLMTSYFNSKVDTAAHFGPYLEMFKMLCATLIFVLIATNLKSFKAIMHGKYTRKDQIVCLIIFSVLGIVASKWCIDINGTPANVRCLVVMISGLFGGPVVGIPVGIISGAYRFTLGGVTALPCSISTVLSGIIGSLIFMWNDKKFPRTIAAITLMFLFTGFEMLMIVILTPPNISFPYIRNIYPIMLFASVIGITLFSIVVKEEREKENTIITYEKQKIQEFKEEYDEKIGALKAEIEELKKNHKKDND